jgi:ubiquinone biosynthesis protein UbiJ
MARPKNTTSTTIIEDVQLAGDLTANLNTLSVLQAEYNDERDLLNQLLGQAQMAEAFGKFSQTVWSSKLSFVKESKLYQSLKGKRTPNGLELSGTWAEFCSLLGVSDEKANQDIANLHAFGEEALESMSRMGIGYRELRQFRRLPEDQKSALIEVARDGDKTALLELAEEMIARHAKEKENLKTDLEISRQTLAEKKNEINVLKDQTDELKARLTRRATTETPDEEGMALETEATGFKSGVLSALLNLKCGFDALAAHEERTGINHTPLMAGLLDDVEARVIDLRQLFDLPEFREINTISDWAKDAIDSDSGLQP